MPARATSATGFTPEKAWTPLAMTWAVTKAAVATAGTAFHQPAAGVTTEPASTAPTSRTSPKNSTSWLSWRTKPSLKAANSHIPPASASPTRRRAGHSRLALHARAATLAVTTAATG